MSNLDDALKGTEGNATLGAADAFAAIALVAIAADGQVTPEETTALTNTLSRMKLYEGWSKEQFAAALKRINISMRQLGITGLIAEAAKQGQRLKRNRLCRSKRPDAGRRCGRRNGEKVFRSLANRAWHFGIRRRQNC